MDDDTDNGPSGASETEEADTISHHAVNARGDERKSLSAMLQTAKEASDIKTDVGKRFYFDDGDGDGEGDQKQVIVSTLSPKILLSTQVSILLIS